MRSWIYAGCYALDVHEHSTALPISMAFELTATSKPLPCVHDYIHLTCKALPEVCALHSITQTALE